MDKILGVLSFLPMLIAPIILAIYSMVSAYVFKFGLPKTGIIFDYMLFTVVVAIGLWVGGAI